MINPIDPGWIRIGDALHKQDRRQRRRRRREGDEEEGAPGAEDRIREAKAKLDLVA